MYGSCYVGDMLFVVQIFRDFSCGFDVFGIIFQNLTRIMQRRYIEVGATYILLYTYILVVHWINWR